VILTASILRIYVTWQGTNVKLLDDDTEMSKHVAVYIIRKDTVVMYICAFVGCNKNNKNKKNIRDIIILSLPTAH
jgi:hypothetical protein